MKNYFFLIIKGIGMGAANVIPGVSGGTIALITGIFERLINAIKSFDFVAIKLIFTGKFKEFIKKTDLYFLLAVFTGIGIAVLSLAKLLEFLFRVYPVQVWAFFFGLILISVYFVGKTVKKWSLSVILVFIVGLIISLSLAFMTPASESDNMLYLIICGIVASCSMILPGISGSFVLVLMGNYELIMIDAVTHLNIKILAPVAVGAAIGLLGFSYFLSWVFKKYKDQTISILTGFMLGSLLVIWPWKEAIYKLAASGEFVLKPDGEKIISGYKYLYPDSFDVHTISAILILICGGLLIYVLETLASKFSKEE
ncbi:MAG: DUF368 domain-containing protein [Bacteroidetes bacterium HGW-Bacteroidetes-21]|nr:MAG: DUF368 domain-containing protein [Bacteroidetes bacterium HGW-Bacteroidetes-21]